MASVSGLNALEKRAAFSLAAVFGFRMLGLFMLMPVFAIYGADLEGFSPLWIGLAIGAYGLTQAILQVPMGLLSDRFGRRPVIVGGLVLFAIGSVVAALADSVYMVTLGRAIQGTGAIASAVLALAADLTRDEQRPKVMGFIGMCIGLSFSIALILGPIITEVSGLSGLFWTIAALAVLGIFIVLISVPHSVNKAPKGETIAVPAMMKQLITHPQLIRLDVGVMLLHLCMTAIFVAFPPLLIDAGLPALSHWQVYFPVVLLSFVFMVPMIIITAKKQCDKTMFLVAIVGVSFSLFGLYLWHESMLQLAVALFVFFVGFNYLEASLPSLVARISPVGHKGSAMGIFSSSQFLGAFLGGILGGFIVQRYGYEVLFAASATIGLLWTLFALGMKIPTRSQLISLPSSISSTQDADAAAEQLVALEGVLEATVVLEDKTTYLKVESQRFNIEQARQIVCSGH